MTIFKNKNQKGFTLIEAMVSMTIIVMATIGPLGLIVNSVGQIRQERNRIAAAFLAEEVVENFRAYRDSFVLACKQVDYNYSLSEGIVESATCSFGGASSNVTKDVLQNSGTNPRAIAWYLFLGKIDSRLEQALYLDNDSFSTLAGIVRKGDCETLRYSSLYGSYNCSNGELTDFKRTTTISKVSESSLKVEVRVYYTPKRFIEVVDYIYER